MPSLRHYLKAVMFIVLFFVAGAMINIAFNYISPWLLSILAVSLFMILIIRTLAGIISELEKKP